MPLRFLSDRGDQHVCHRRRAVPYAKGAVVCLSVALLSVGLLPASQGAASQDAASQDAASQGVAGAVDATTVDLDGRPDPVIAASELSDAAVLDPRTGQMLTNPDEELGGAPIDRGDPAVSLRSSASSTGDPAYRRIGSWSPAMAWPQVPIHASLTPDGRVMTFGTDAGGNQGAQFGYSVWDPVNGEHLVLPNTTPTDIFCSAQILLPGSGDLLLAGGDIRARGVSDGRGGIRDNWGVEDVNRFRYSDGSLSRDAPMRYARWYPSVLTLADGRILASGGVDENGRPVGHPEIYSPDQASWRVLEGIRYRELYPRTFVAPTGRVVAVVGSGVHWVDVEGRGAIRRAATLRSSTNWMMPAVEYDVGKLMVIRGNGGTSLIDVSGASALVVEGAAVGKRREWSSLTVLADGQVLLTGGGVDNSGGDKVSLEAALWDQGSGAWTAAAVAAKAREYHSLALLLPDGRVLAAGGGAPGPVLHLNAEIYTPPYLYDEAGELAQRPAIASAPATMTPGQLPYELRLASADEISKVALVRTGSVTHAFNFDQGFMNLPFSQAGEQLSIDIDRPSTVLRPGFYMLFAFDVHGVPSVAHIVRVDQRGDLPVAVESSGPALAEVSGQIPGQVVAQLLDLAPSSRQ